MKTCRLCICINFSDPRQWGRGILATRLQWSSITVTVTLWAPSTYFFRCLPSLVGSLRGDFVVSSSDYECRDMFYSGPWKAVRVSFLVVLAEFLLAQQQQQHELLSPPGAADRHRFPRVL